MLVHHVHQVIHMILLERIESILKKELKELPFLHLQKNETLNFFENFGRDDKFIKEAKALLDLGETNGNLEMIRLNKKFDIFLKRFMKVEEDIKEIKNNFFRVMHCAFAKYEEGFKRKNEYLERRRVRKREEIEKGV
jgi:hypothetical protein